jgi:hypothetical protein
MRTTLPISWRENRKNSPVYAIEPAGFLRSDDAFWAQREVSTQRYNDEVAHKTKKSERKKDPFFKD